ncbi:hypothetical protein HanPSC8_Chr02g0062791 [Helianthus annuus]|nr:hypothetical protein HanPSC8_Chr02g0062791 [Helianthus annuus]
MKTNTNVYIISTTLYNVQETTITRFIFIKTNIVYFKSTTESYFYKINKSYIFDSTSNNPTSFYEMNS